MQLHEREKHGRVLALILSLSTQALDSSRLVHSSCWRPSSQSQPQSLRLSRHAWPASPSLRFDNERLAVPQLLPLTLVHSVCCSSKSNQRTKTIHDTQANRSLTPNEKEPCRSMFLVASTWMSQLPRVRRGKPLSYTGQLNCFNTAPTSLMIVSLHTFCWCCRRGYCPCCCCCHCWPVSPLS